ncbi:MAG: hypothetical protein Q4D55_04900 [Eubacteriales bacterium]|nr:hypothetical protein [Eubacteriales bacterium]
MKQKRTKLVRTFFLALLLTALIPSGNMFISSPAGTVQAAGLARPKLNKKKASIQLNKTVTLKVPSAASKVKWKVSKPSVLKIQKLKGAKKNTAVIRGIKKGKATVTAQIGKIKLKATITVKHTHSITIPATCTEPAKCSCGATFGTALGHNMGEATCQKPSTCARCGVTSGTISEHKFDNTTDHCVWCNELNLKKFVYFALTHTSTSSDAAYDVHWIGMAAANVGSSSLTVLGGAETASLCPTAGAAPLPVYLTNSSNKVLDDYTLLPNYRGAMFWDTLTTNSRFTFSPTGTVTFRARYGETLYRITVKSDGKYDFVRA